jgi:hypothetical protein
MSLPQITPSDRRTVAGGLTVIAALIFGVRVVPEIHRWSDSQLRAAEAAVASVQRVKAVLGRRGWTRRALHRVDTLLAPYDSAMLTGASVAAGGAALSNVVSEAAEAAGAELASIQLRRDSLVGATLTHVSASATITGDVESLAMFLETIEAGPPIVGVRQINITGGGGSAATSPRESLRMEVLVEGVIRRPRQGAAR